MVEKIKRYTKLSKLFVKSKFENEDGAGWLLLQQILIAPMSLLTTVLLAKVLSIESYGYYKYILSVYGVISIFGLSGFFSISFLNVQRGQDEFFNIGFRYRKLLRWIPAIITIFVSLYYFYNNNNFLGLLFLITIFSHLFVDLYDLYIIGTTGKGDFKLNAKLAVMSYLFSFFPPILVAYFISQNLYLVFGTMFISQFLFRFFAFIYVKKKYNFHFNKDFILDLKKKKEFERESLSLSINNALGGLNGNASSAIVFNRLGAEATAVYSLAITFADFIYGIISAPLSKTLLILSKMTREGVAKVEKIKLIKSMTKSYFWLAFLGMILCMVALPFVYKFLFAKYFFSFKYAVVYSLSILAVAFYPGFQYFFEARNIKLLNIVQIVNLIIGLTALFFASWYFGLWGAIIVAMIMRFGNNLVCLFMVRNEKV